SKWASMWFMQQAQETRPERRIGGSNFLTSAPAIHKTSIAPPPTPSEPPVERSSAASSLPHSRLSAKLGPSSSTRSSNIGRVAASRSVTSTEKDDHSAPQSGLRIFEDECSDSGRLTSPGLVSHLRRLLSLRVKIGRRSIVLALGSIIAFFFLATW